MVPPMKCPHCGKSVSPRSKACKHCNVRFVRKSDKMVRKMTVSPGFASACGIALFCLGLILVLNDAFLFAGLACAVGILFLLIGKTAR